MGAFKPYFVSSFPRGKFLSDAIAHETMGKFMDGQGFMMSFFKVGEVFFEGGEDSFSYSWVGLRFISKEKGKWGYFGGMVRGSVMLEFSSGKKVGPGSGIVGAENTEVGFHLLIDSFSLSISLGMIGCGESDVVVEELGKFLSKGRSKLGASIGN